MSMGGLEWELRPQRPLQHTTHSIRSLTHYYTYKMMVSYLQGMSSQLHEETMTLTSIHSLKAMGIKIFDKHD